MPTVFRLPKQLRPRELPPPRAFPGGYILAFPATTLLLLFDAEASGASPARPINIVCLFAGIVVYLLWVYLTYKEMSNDEA